MIREQSSIKLNNPRNKGLQVKMLMKSLIYAHQRDQVAYYKNISLNITYIIKALVRLEATPISSRAAQRCNFNKIARCPVQNKKYIVIIRKL